jgi:hypothetical protein
MGGYLNTGTSSLSRVFIKDFQNWYVFSFKHDSNLILNFLNFFFNFKFLQISSQNCEIVISVWYFLHGLWFLCPSKKYSSQDTVILRNNMYTLITCLPGPRRDSCPTQETFFVTLINRMEVYSLLICTYRINFKDVAHCRSSAP